jgi:hypothetical protein
VLVATTGALVLVGLLTVPTLTALVLGLLVASSLVDLWLRRRGLL